MKPNKKALLPLVVFVLFYVLSGVVLAMRGIEMPFYQIPSPISIMIGVAVAFIIFEGTINEKADDFVKGCGDENIIIMCIIYLLAGAFAQVTKASGAVDSVVNFSLSIVPVNFLVPGIFLISTFLSIATGSSVGSVVALGPIVFGVAEKIGINPALMLAALICGAMAGDNLSLISDTTIAATRTQNIGMKQKFVMNSRFAFPAIIISTIIFAIIGRQETTITMVKESYNLVYVIPYLLVIVTALMGMNVLLVLFSGTLLAGIIGMIYGKFDTIMLSQTIFEGFTGVLEIFLLSMFTGGLAYMVRKHGGIDWIIMKVKKKVKGQKSAEAAIATLVGLTNAAVANNTVSILITGQVASEMTKEYDVKPSRVASLLDTTSCVVQGIIPYGAQILIASGLTAGKVAPTDILPFMVNQYVLLAMMILTIITRFGTKSDPATEVPDAK
ncbi:MAG: Na+/H+ antiporter NhaC family protein [Finegoldia magna]|nr:Na+/H+ antiporter NhaC family protein [Finegoldia magna]